jgi:hypothetical protein
MSFGERQVKGECAEGLVVLSKILPGMLLGINIVESKNVGYFSVVFNL